MRNPLNPPLTESTTSNEVLSQAVFSDWCKMFDIDIEDIPTNVEPNDKIALYDSAFQLGTQKFLDDFLFQNEGSFDIRGLKSELDVLRTSGNIEILGKREHEIALDFQRVISSYTYQGTTNHPADILDLKEMNCVGASLIGGLLLNAVGIHSVLAGGGSHSFLIMTTSDDRIWWQDMQDGKEVPELYNQELTAEKIMGVENGVRISPEDIGAFARNPTQESLSFILDIGSERWKNEPITIEPFLSGIERQELINTGFQLTNQGKHRESLEILEIAQQKSPNVADVYLGLAKALRGLGRYDEAIVKCTKALELDPTYSYVQDEMAEIRKHMTE
jgi:hypothetical protein